MKKTIRPRPRILTYRPRKSEVPGGKTPISPKVILQHSSQSSDPMIKQVVSCNVFSSHQQPVAIQVGPDNNTYEEQSNQEQIENTVTSTMSSVSLQLLPTAGMGGLGPLGTTMTNQNIVMVVIPKNQINQIGQILTISPGIGLVHMPRISPNKQATDQSYLTEKNKLSAFCKKIAQDIFVNNAKPSLKELVPKVKSSELDCASLEESVIFISSSNRVDDISTDPKRSMKRVTSDPKEKNLNSLLQKSSTLSDVGNNDSSSKTPKVKFIHHSENPNKNREFESSRDLSIDNSSINQAETVKSSISYKIGKNRCIVCKVNFKDRAKLYRHAKLAHPAYQIFFCEYCDNSFLSQAEFHDHGFENCRTLMTVYDFKIGKESSKFHPTVIMEYKNCFTEDTKVVEIQPVPESRLTSAKKCCGRPRKTPITSQYNYVDKEVMSHSPTSSQFKSAKIKRMVIEMNRLEGPILHQHLEKLLKKPVIDFANENRKYTRKAASFKRLENSEVIGGEKRLKRSLERLRNLDKEINLAKRRRLRANAKYVTNNVSSGNDEVSLATSIDGDSETVEIQLNETIRQLRRKSEKDRKETTRKVVYTDSNDTDVDCNPSSLSKKANSFEKNEALEKAKNDAVDKSLRPVIRKLTSRSSAGSAMMLEVGKKRYDLEKVTSNKYSDITDDGENPNNKDDPTTSYESLNIIKLQKPYLQKNPVLCNMCTKYTSLTNQLEAKYKLKSVKKISIGCPLCKLHFISMMKLQVHLANFHLKCTTVESCKKAKALSKADSKIIEDVTRICDSQTKQLVNFFEVSDKEKSKAPNKRSFYLKCGICGQKFIKRLQYIFHVQSVHKQSKTTSPILTENIPSNKSPDTSLVTENDNDTAARKFVLKQLLSDDSHEDGDCEDPPTVVESEINDSSGKKVIGFIVNDQSCKICGQRFKRTQDLIMHSFKHEHENPAIHFKDSHSSPSKNKKIPLSKNQKTNDNLNRAKPRKTKKLEKLEPQRSTDPRTRAQKKAAAIFQELVDTENGLANSATATINDKVPIECSKCNRKFANQALLNEHLFFLHDDSLKDTVLTDLKKSEQPTEQTEWHCYDCSQNFKLLQSFRRHRYLIHADDSMVHICENCYKILATVTMVNVHICSDVASYKCRSCNETFSTGMSLRIHNSDKHLEEPGSHECVPCEKTFLTQAMLKTHEKCNHRFMRLYNPRAGSPVEALEKHGESADVKLYGDYEDDNEWNENKNQTSDLRNPSPRNGEDENRSAIVKGKRKLEKPRESSRIPKDKTYNITAYIKEREITQCSICHLYCLSKSALYSHRKKMHASSCEVCQLCREIYGTGQLIRHMIDCHITPSDSNTRCVKGKNQSIWDVRKTTTEEDIEEFIRILGFKRLMNLYEYRRFSKSNDILITCPWCDEDFEGYEWYKYHFFMNHDKMCVLCNIEYTSGENAANHKCDEHGPFGSYIWFAVRTVDTISLSALFEKVANDSFIEMISEATDEATESEEELIEDDTEVQLLKEENGVATAQAKPENDRVLVTTQEGIEKSRHKVKAENEIVTVFENIKKSDNAYTVEGIVESPDDEKSLIVVTEEDIDRYITGTPYPNIWSLATKISSTCQDFTPTDIKKVLESYFEK